MKFSLLLVIILNYSCFALGIFWFYRLKKWSNYLRQKTIEFGEKEKEFREVYTDGLMRVYSAIEFHSLFESDKEKIKKLKDLNDKLHSYIVRLELCDIPVKEENVKSSIK